MGGVGGQLGLRIAAASLGVVVLGQYFVMRDGEEAARPINLLRIAGTAAAVTLLITATSGVGEAVWDISSWLGFAEGEESRVSRHRRHHHHH